MSTRVPEIIGVSVFSIVLAVVPVLARLYFRRSSKLPFLGDDYLIVAAASVAVTDASLYLVCIRYGFGRMMETVPLDSLLRFFEFAWATFLLYGAAISLVKFSVLAFYYRIFPRSFPRALVVLAVLSALWWVLFTLLTIFQCIPIQKNWDDRVEGACLNYLNVYLAIQVLNIVLDAAILVLPISAVVKLQMSRANKISVAGTFALGGLAVIFAIVRLYVLVHNRNQTDITYETATASWSLIEPCFQIFCACLPCMTPLLKAVQSLVRKMSSMSSRSRSRLLGSSGGSCSREGMVCTTCGGKTFATATNDTTGTSFVGDKGMNQNGISVSTTWSSTANATGGSGSRASAETRIKILDQPRQTVRAGGNGGGGGAKSVPIVVLDHRMV